MNSFFDNRGHDLRELVIKLSSSRSLQMIVTVDELATLPVRSIHAAIIKASLYSDTVIVVFNPLHRYEWDGNQPLTTMRKDLVPPNPTIEHLANTLRDEASVVFVPAGLTLDEEGFDGTGRSSWTSTLFSFRDTYANPWGMNLTFSSPILRSNFGEISEPEVKLWLPHIANLSLDTFFKLRNDELSLFNLLHDELKQFLRSCNSTDDESRVIELGLHLDSEIRKYKESLKAIKSRYPVALGQMAIGTAAVGLTAVLPDRVQQLVAGFLGAAQVRDGIARLFNNWERRVETQHSPFYLGWLLDNMNAQDARRSRD